MVPRSVRVEDFRGSQSSLSGLGVGPGEEENPRSVQGIRVLGGNPQVRSPAGVGWSAPPGWVRCPLRLAPPGEPLLTRPELLSAGWAPGAHAERRGGAALAPSLTRSLAGTHAGADSCAGADKGSHKETIEERDKRRRQRAAAAAGAAASGSDAPHPAPHPSPVLLLLCPEFRRASSCRCRHHHCSEEHRCGGGGGCWPGRGQDRAAPASPSSRGDRCRSRSCAKSNLQRRM